MAKSQTKKNNKLSLPVIIIVALLIVAIVVLGFVYRDTISAIIAGNIGTEEGEQNTSVSSGTSVLGGSPSITLPVEINTVGLEVHFIDVGQGDAILLRFADGTDILIDAGSGTSENAATTEAFKAYLSDIALDSIDCLIVTHAHSDHMNLLDDVLDEYAVSSIYYNGYADAPTQKFFTTFEEKVAAEGATVTRFDEDGDIYDLSGDDYKITVYAPGYDFTNVNYESPFVLVEYAGRKLFFTGDAEKPTEDWFMSTVGTDANLDIDILKVGHHGSKEGTTEDFLKFLKPEYAVISVGETNSYNHPNPMTMNDLFNAGVVTYRTNRHGNIVVYIDTDGDFAFGVEKEAPVENNSKLINDRMIIKQNEA